MNPTILKKLREDKGITQKELAAQIMVSPSAVSQYERELCSPSRDTENRIAQYFSVSVDYLNGESKYPEIERQLNQIYGENSTLHQVISSMLHLSEKHKNSITQIIMSFEKDDIK